MTDTEHVVGEIDAGVVELIERADLVLYDSSYTDVEYQLRKGWGHSTWQEAIKLADAAGVRKLLLFHHDPSHGDDFLDGVAVAAASVRPGTEVAREGAEFIL